MKYGIDMTIRQILEEEETAALFHRCLPGMEQMLGRNAEAKNMTVRQIAAYTGGRIPPQALDALDAGLKDIGRKNGGISPAERRRMERYQAISAELAGRRPGKAVHHQDAVYPGRPWLDISGSRIHAHAGGFLYEDGTYYWYGENKEFTDGQCEIWTWGIRLYASRDFYNWEDRGLIIPPVVDDPESELYPEKRVDRPHILKNPNTGKFVCWVKTCGADALFNVFTADSLTGKWEAVNSRYKPFGLSVGDFDIALNEETNTAYLYCEAEHSFVAGMRLNADFTAAEEIVSRQYENINPPFTREGVTVLNRGGRLWMLTSGMTGYVPNQSDSAVSDDYEQPFVSAGDPHVGDESLASFNSQISQVFKVPGKKELYLAVADRWVPEYKVNRELALSLRRAVSARYDRTVAASDADAAALAASPGLATANTSLADYVILPITFENDIPRIHWRDKWRLEDFE